VAGVSERTIHLTGDLTITEDSTPGGAQRQYEVRVLGALPLRPGKVVLDVGAGEGQRSLWLAGERGCDVIAVDPNASNVWTLREHAANRGLERQITPHCGDVCALPLPNGAADMAVALAVLGGVRDRTRALSEIARCLKPGGLLLLGVYLPAEDAGWLQRRLVSTALGWPAPVTKPALEDALGAAGFTTLQTVQASPPPSVGAGKSVLDRALRTGGWEHLVIVARR